MNDDIVIRFNRKTGKYRVKLPMVTSINRPDPLPSSFWLVNQLTGDIAEFDGIDEVMEALLRHYAFKP